MFRIHSGRAMETRGFTLLELMLVIAVILLAGGFAWWQWSAYQASVERALHTETLQMGK